MRSVAAHLVLTFVMVMDSIADKDFLSPNFFLDGYDESISGLSFASTDSSNPNAEEAFENGNSPDQLFVSADSSALDNSQPDQISGYWDEGLSTLLADADNPNCISGESQLSARIRARDDTCVVSPAIIEPPTVFDLSDPNLKMKPICPMTRFPFYTIAVCSSGNFLDEFGPISALLLYDSEQGESIYTPWFTNTVEVLKCLVSNPADLLACTLPRKLYCCRTYIPVEDLSVQRSDDSLHGRPVCYSRRRKTSSWI